VPLLLCRVLCDPDFAASYLAAAMKDDEAIASIDALLHAVREIALLHENDISGAVQAARVGRQTLHDGFRPGGNPQMRAVDRALQEWFDESERDQLRRAIIEGCAEMADLYREEEEAFHASDEELHRAVDN
jgi:DNA-binding phage protein